MTAKPFFSFKVQKRDNYLCWKIMVWPQAFLKIDNNNNNNLKGIHLYYYNPTNSLKR